VKNQRNSDSFTLNSQQGIFWRLRWLLRAFYYVSIAPL